MKPRTLLKRRTRRLCDDLRSLRILMRQEPDPLRDQAVRMRLDKVDESVNVLRDLVWSRDSLD